MAIVLSTQAQLATATTQAIRPLPGVDADIHPGNDFFGYANGDWLKATEIPAGHGRWTVRDELRAQAQAQVARLLEDPQGSQTHAAIARKVADFRAAFLDTAAIEAQGLACIDRVLRRIAALRNKTELAHFIGSELRADVDPMGFGDAQSSHLFGLAVDKGLDGERTNAAILVQGGLGLADREHYLDPAGSMQALRDRYRNYLAHLSSQTRGGAWSSQRIGAVLALEAALAQGHATREQSADENNARHRWARADFARQAPGLDWVALLAAAGLAREESFIVWQPDAFRATAALVGSQPLQVWKDYLVLRTIDRHAAVLPRTIADAALAMHSAAAGVGKPPTREQLADIAVQQALGEWVTRLYAERHFPPARKARVKDIATKVAAVLRERAASAAWLSPSAREHAVAKLQTVYFGLGYPEHWDDDEELDIRRDDALGNLRRAASWRTRQVLKQLSQPVDVQRWLLPGHAVTAGLVFTRNAYNFPAALLQAPKFDATQPADPDAFNFGAIGAIVGHELTHFIDTLGADYDARGAKRRWWNVDDMARYQASNRLLVEQFSSYRLFDDVAIDGQVSLTENFADLVGLAAAFEAYRRTLGSRVADKEFVRRQDRLFFIGFARSWRAKYSNEALRRQAATDHPPEAYRCATVRNFDAWYDAFDVKPGHRLYLEPAARIQPWPAAR